jgi:hypothetical protein
MVTLITEAFSWFLKIWSQATDKRLFAVLRSKILSLWRKNRAWRVVLSAFAILMLLSAGAVLYAVFLEPRVEREKVQVMPDGGQTIYRDGIAISVPPPAIQDAMRKDLYEFHNRILRSLYGDSTEFVNEIYSKQFGNQANQPKDLNGVIGGLLRYYVEDDFAQEYTKLSDVIRSGEKVPYLELRDRGRSFFRSYNRFAFWVQHAVIKSGIDLNRSDYYSDMEQDRCRVSS